MDTLHFTCRGQSHIDSGKVCQDASETLHSSDLDIAIVSDGHGGTRYFRSDRGSRIAVEVTREMFARFMTDAAHTLLEGVPFTAVEALTTQIERQEFGKTSDVQRAFRQLFAAIIYEWSRRIRCDAKASPLTETEMAGLKPEWIDDFRHGKDLEKVYGCTLMAFACHRSVWAAFQIGDGKLYTVDTDGLWHEPVPWDDRCFLNKTTSLSDASAIDEFRFCCQGDGILPLAAILASDGLDDSFGTAENQQQFYTGILKSIELHGRENTLLEIEKALPRLSARGSKDDMSLAMVYDPKRLATAYRNLISWQMNIVHSRMVETKETLRQTAIKREVYASRRHDRTAAIEYHYAVADEKRLLRELDALESRLEALNHEMRVYTLRTR